MSSLIRCLAAIALLAMPCVGHAAEHAAKRPHILAIASCPPRPEIGRQPTEACARFLPRMSAALAKRLGAAPGDVHHLINAQATVPAVLAAVRKIGGRLGPNDRLVIYMLTHGGAATSVKGQDEVFMMWTERKPVFLELGIAEGLYMPAAELAAAVHASKAGEVVVIVDACEAGLAEPDFVDKHPANRPERPVAVIASTGRNQFAEIKTDFTPLFGANLLAALRRPYATLADAIADADAATRRDAPAVCREMTARYPSRLSATSPCRGQNPVRVDPSNLLARITLRPVQRRAKN